MGEMKVWTKALAAQRASEAWELRCLGHGWREIAERTGYANASNCMRSVKRWREGIPEIDRERFRDEAVGRLGVLLRQAYADVADRRPGAVTAAVRAEQRLSELLGLDAAKMSEVVHHQGADLSVIFDRVGVPELPVIEGHLVAELEEER